MKKILITPKENLTNNKAKLITNAINDFMICEENILFINCPLDVNLIDDDIDINYKNKSIKL